MVPPNGAAQNRLAKARLKTGGGVPGQLAGGMVPSIDGTVYGAADWRHRMVLPIGSTVPPPNSAAVMAAGRKGAA